MGPVKGNQELPEARSYFLRSCICFDDPLSVTVPDPDHSAREDRSIIVGQSHQGHLLIVSFAERTDRFRIISARELTRAERRAYEEERHE